MSTVRLTIDLDSALKRKVKIHAARKDTTVSALIRKWIEAGLKAESLPPLATERPMAGPPPIPNGRNRRG